MPVLLNADDFGLCAAVNRAVARAHDQGALASASLLANGPAFEEAVAIARARPGLAVGVHLNVLRGRPVSGSVPTLAGEDGLFLGDARRLFLRGAFGRLSRRELLQETLAQVEKVRAAGLVPTHLDGEKHSHQWCPGLFSVVLEVVARVGIPRVRVVRERFSLADLLVAPRQTAFAALLTAIGRELAGRARARGLVVADRVFGCARTGRMTAEDLVEAASTCRGELVEVLVHPGEPEPGDEPTSVAMGRFRIGAGWTGEARALREFGRLRLRGGGDRGILAPP